MSSERYKPAPLISVEHNGKTYRICEDEKWFFDQDIERSEDEELLTLYETRTTINGFVFNEHGICLNTAIGFNVDLKKHWDLRIDIAQVSVDPELWSACYHYNAGTGGGGGGVSLYWDHKFATPAEAEINELETRGLKYFNQNDSKAVKMRKCITDRIADLKLEYNITEPKEIITNDEKGQYQLMLE